VDGPNRGPGGPRESDAATRGELERELRRLEAGDPFTALGLSYDADDHGVRSAFLAATKRLHPNRFARCAPPVRALANEVFLLIKGAYGAIDSGEGRARVLARLGRAPAAPTAAPAAPAAPAIGEGSGLVRPAFPNVPRVVLTPPGGTRMADVRPPERGPREARIESNGPATPVAGGRSVQQLRQEVLERKLQEEFDAAVGKLDQGFFEVARREFHRMAVADPGDRKYRVWMHQAKARELQAGGRLDEARAEYRRALDLDDGFAPARAALAGLEPGGDRGPGGLFSKLFRK
jgi:tetratricopeptide (TPR) repeat protein